MNIVLQKAKGYSSNLLLKDLKKMFASLLLPQIVVIALLVQFSINIASFFIMGIYSYQLEIDNQQFVISKMFRQIQMF